MDLEGKRGRGLMVSTASRNPPDQLDIEIGIAIRLRRRQMKISQELLAERCGVTYQAIQKYENGDNRVSFSRLVQIAHAMGMRLIDLVGDIDGASELSRDDALILQVMSVPGALDLIKDFARLSPDLRAKARDCVRAMAGTPTENARI